MPALSQYSSPMTTNRGRELNFVPRFSSKSAATLGSDITIVGRRPIHKVKIGPYIWDHFSNCIHGEDDGIMSLFPMNGRGVGPGGSRRYRRKSRISMKVRGSRITPSSKVYGPKTKNCSMDESASFSRIARNAILKVWGVVDQSQQQNPALSKIDAVHLPRLPTLTDIL